MESIDKFTIPEISSPKRANRKKRKARGQNVKDWENLRERWPDAPESIEGVGLVSAHTSYTGSPGDVSGGAKELQAEEIIPRRVVKKRRRRTVMDSDEVAAEILNPPPTPAGHTVTAFGGGIIPEITNGGINRDAITGKALPRIGRRILNNAKITGDQNPLTRVDGNNNGVIFDGTAREMPDPTPGGSITGQMGFIDKFKKNKPNQVAPKKYAPTTNNTPFGGVENLIAEQAEQVKKFETWAASRDWKKFHSEHFDWWTFPIDRGSAGFGFRYDINGQPLEELKQRPDYLKSLSRATDLYMQSMAWDLKKQDWMDKPDFDKGQDPTNNINTARLFKIARSLQIHNLDDEFNSVRTMALSLRNGGYGIGNDVFWNDPENYNTRSSHLRNGGITGSMAGGLGISPTAYRDAVDNGPQRDTHKELGFIKKWLDRDTSNFNFFTKGKKSDSGDLTFWWKDDSTRIDYIKKHKRGGLPKGFSNFSDNPPDNKKTKIGFSPKLEKLMDDIKQLGLIYGTGGSHGGLYDQYGNVFTHSGTAKNQETAYAHQARDLIGLFSKEINPSQYWDRYWSWVNNPYVTAKDKKGNEVGVRLAFNNDEDKLLEEFDKRIQQLVDSIRSSYGLKPSKKEREDKPVESSDYAQIPDFIINKILENIDNKLNDRIESATTIKHLTEELRDSVANLLEDSSSLTVPMVEKLIKDKRKEFLARKQVENPKFLGTNTIDSISSSVAKDIRDSIQILSSYEIDEGKNPGDSDMEEFGRLNYPYVDIEVIKELHRQEVQKLLNNK